MGTLLDGSGAEAMLRPEGLVRPAGLRPNVEDVARHDAGW